MEKKERDDFFANQFEMKLFELFLIEFELLSLADSENSLNIKEFQVRNVDCFLLFNDTKYTSYEDMSNTLVISTDIELKTEILANLICGTLLEEKKMSIFEDVCWVIH